MPMWKKFEDREMLGSGLRLVNCVVRGGVREKMAFEQRPEGRKIAVTLTSRGSVLGRETTKYRVRG